MIHGFSATTSVPDPHTVEVRLRGDLTFGNADDLEVVIADQLRDHPGIHELVLDCADVTAIDSMGLSALLMIKRRAEQAHARLRLDNRPPRLDRVLDLTGTYAHITGEAART